MQLAHKRLFGLECLALPSRDNYREGPSEDTTQTVSYPKKQKNYNSIF